MSLLFRWENVRGNGVNGVSTAKRGGDMVGEVKVIVSEESINGMLLRDKDGDIIRRLSGGETKSQKMSGFTNKVNKHVMFVDEAMLEETFHSGGGWEETEQSWLMNSKPTPRLVCH